MRQYAVCFIRKSNGTQKCIQKTENYIEISFANHLSNLINFVKPCKVITFSPWFSLRALSTKVQIYLPFQRFCYCNRSFFLYRKNLVFITLILNQLSNLHYRVFRHFSSQISMIQCITFELSLCIWYIQRFRFDTMRRRMFNKSNLFLINYVDCSTHIDTNRLIATNAFDSVKSIMYKNGKVSLASARQYLFNQIYSAIFNCGTCRFDNNKKKG